MKKTLELEDCPFHYWEGGKQNAPLVVFLHGACVGHHSFDPIVPVIAENYHVLSLNNREFITSKLLDFLAKWVPVK